ncbi:MAG: hypothetical protein HFE98_02690 [Ruminiclostridium sp.]|nr:hypothetical protein [Ruminiclostridium sp.]
MKKMISCLLVCVMLFSCCGSAFAAGSDTYASLSISSVSASMSTGTNPGEVRVIFSAKASKPASLIGASIITIYQSNGIRVATIYGSTANRLMASNTSSKSGSYTYKGNSGTSYYAVVSLGATAGGESDSRNITTNVARAK